MSTSTVSRRASRGLREELKQTRPFPSLEEEVHLNLQRTASFLLGDFLELFRRFELTPAQYNVLRILRGAGSGGLPILEIRERLVTRVPDITRLVDRLETAQLVLRERLPDDRRVVQARITAAGKSLLAKLERPVRSLHRSQLGHLAKRQLTALNELLVAARHVTGRDDDD